MRNFYTLFDVNYAANGLALHSSLLRQFNVVVHAGGYGHRSFVTERI